MHIYLVLREVRQMQVLGRFVYFKIKSKKWQAKFCICLNLIGKNVSVLDEVWLSKKKNQNTCAKVWQEGFHNVIIDIKNTLFNLELFSYWFRYNPSNTTFCLMYLFTLSQFFANHFTLKIVYSACIIFRYLIAFLRILCKICCFSINYCKFSALP